MAAQILQRQPEIIAAQIAQSGMQYLCCPKMFAPLHARRAYFESSANSRLSLTSE
jgi:hypothetical protein